MTSLKKFSPLLTTAVLIAPGLAASAAAQTLDDARAAIRKGTAAGITIVPARSRAASAPQGGAPAASATAASVTAAPVGGSPGPAMRPAEPAGAPGKVSGFLSALPPPSGQPLSATKRLNTPDLGIPVPASAPGGR